jgi:hypothetical protein
MTTWPFGQSQTGTGETMFRKHKLATAVAVLGALTIAAHVTLGAAGIMTAAQWQSGAVIGAILLVAAAARLALAR